MSRDENAADPVGLLAEEFIARYRRGERPALTEYTDKHPEFAERIRQVFPMMLMMEQAGHDTGLSASEPGPGAGVALRNVEHVAGYRILREIGRGGMGVVYEAEQVALGRRVALKILPQHVAPNESALARFRREAQAAARLHHTNIVPVFEVGDHAGIHFYAMQYIEGQTLDDVLNEVRRLRAGEADTLAPSPPDTATGLADALLTETFQLREQAPVEKAKVEGKEPAAPSSQLPALSGEAASSRSKRQYHRSVAELGIQVAEALDYAHKQGILHRDIKPSNLLVDVRGTVWVTDFGLAKAEGCDNLTGQGDLLGTLRYMAPERFDGQADARSDLCSLGLTLYEMIALRPAFDATSQAELVEQVLNDEPPRLRGVESSIPRDLETIITKSIRKEPGRRYQTAAELAEDLRRFLEDRPIRARRTGLVERGWRWCRRHPSKAALVGTVAVAASLVLVGALWYAQQTAIRAQRVRDALVWATDLRDQGKWVEARAVAEPLLQAGEASAETREQLHELLADLRLLSRLGQIRAGKSEHWDREEQTGRRDAAAEYAQAFRAYAIDIEAMSAEEAAAWIRTRPETVVRELVAAMDDWALECRWGNPKGQAWRHLIAVAQAADLDPWRRELRELIGRRDLAAIQKLVAQADLDALPVQSLQLMGQVLGEAGDPSAAVAWLKNAQRLHPGDVWINYTLADYLEKLQPPRLGDAIGFYRAAVAVRPEIGHRLAHTFEYHGNPDEAITLFRQLIRLQPHDVHHRKCLANAFYRKGELITALTTVDQALAVRPQSADAHALRGRILLDIGRLREALAACDRAVELAPELAHAHTTRGLVLHALRDMPAALAAHDRAIGLNPDSAHAHGNRGYLLADMEKYAEALESCKRAVELKPGLAEAHLNRGRALLRLGRKQEALEALTRSIELKETSAVAHTGRGLALLQLQRPSEALAALDRAIAINPRYAEAYVNRGMVLRFLNRGMEALADYDRAAALNPNLAEAHFNRASLLRDQRKHQAALPAFDRYLELKPNDAIAHNERGVVLMALSRHAEALAAFDRAIELKPDLATPHYNRGLVFSRMGKWSEAVEAYDQSLRLNPEYATAHNNRGNALLQLKKPREALEAFDGALKINPKLAEAHASRGLAWHSLGKLDDALAAFDRAVEVNPDYAEGHYGRGWMLEAAGRKEDALKAYERAAACQPDHFDAHLGRGQLLFDLDKPDEALQAFDRAIELRAGSSHAHYGRGRTLHRLRRLDDAILAYRRAIDHRPDDAQAHCNLGLVLRDLGKFTEALAALRRGHELGTMRREWRYDSAEWVRHCQRLVELDARLPAVLRGEDKPGPEELTEFGRILRNYKHLHAAAAQLYVQAFEAQPELGENLRAGHRYHAACSAALAGCGQGRDAGQLDEQVRARWRKQSLTWLRMHLESWTQRFDKGTPQARAETQRDLELWQREKQLAGLRDPAELAKLPTEEQAAWGQFWADVAALHQRAVRR